ncbi:MAG: phosphatase PAP2 family protein [Candidatus Aenigmarchaeota archaeon]|nr:phosphatase PAP2 family protein [Candidatus Aenigmarchaeota archaeon]
MKVVSYYFHELMENVTLFGSIFTHIVLLAVAFVLNDALFVTLAKGLLLIYAVCVPLKFLRFRERPTRMKHASFWEKFEASSFPSVHAVRVTFLAAALGFRFGNPALSVFLLALAFLVTYSRVFLKKHYWSDAIAGVVIGAGIYALAGAL